MSDGQRFWVKVAIDDEENCWEWLGAKNRGGYGNFCYGRINGKRKYVGAHRFAYEDLREEIPEGLHIDHLCRNPGCVNPWHMEPVTCRENQQRGLRGRMVTHCAQGHEFTKENTVIDGANTTRPGRRRCRECSNARRRKYPSYK